MAARATRSQTKRQSKQRFSPLERLPVEILQHIFCLSCSPNLTDASPYIGMMVSSEQIYQAFLVYAFHNKDSNYQILDLDSKVSVQDISLSAPFATFREMVIKSFEVNAKAFLPIDNYNFEADERIDVQMQIMGRKWFTLERLERACLRLVAFQWSVQQTLYKNLQASSADLELIPEDCTFSRLLEGPEDLIPLRMPLLAVITPDDTGLDDSDESDVEFLGDGSLELLSLLNEYSTINSWEDDEDEDEDEVNPENEADDDTDEGNEDETENQTEIEDHDTDRRQALFRSTVIQQPRFLWLPGSCCSMFCIPPKALRDCAESPEQMKILALFLEPWFINEHIDFSRCLPDFLKRPVITKLSSLAEGLEKAVRLSNLKALHLLTMLFYYTRIIPLDPNFLEGTSWTGGVKSMSTYTNKFYSSALIEMAISLTKDVSDVAAPQHEVLHFLLGMPLSNRIIMYNYQLVTSWARDGRREGNGFAKSLLELIPLKSRRARGTPLILPSEVPRYISWLPVPPGYFGDTFAKVTNRPLQDYFIRDNDGE